MDHKNRFLGAVFIVLGAALILNYYNIISFDIWSLWPVVFIYFGIKAERDYFNGNAGSRNLLLGSILTIYGIYFLSDVFLGYRIMNLLGFLFVLGPAVGFLQMAYYGHRRKSNYRVGVILTVISAFMFVDKLSLIKFDVLIYVAFIFIGLFMMRKNSHDIDNEDNNNDDDDTHHPEERY
ncbi:MAG: hypothetical protein IBX70_00215 [Clostridia bacterium]|nr:hypothetical protein [Clostridia bacterium]